jgi:hypothetical protein
MINGMKLFKINAAGNRLYFFYGYIIGIYQFVLGESAQYGDYIRVV